MTIKKTPWGFNIIDFRNEYFLTQGSGLNLQTHMDKKKKAPKGL